MTPPPPPRPPGDIIILQKCTKNHDHMLHCSWDMVRDRCNYFSFRVIFWPFTGRKIKISKKLKKHLEISSFSTSVPKIMIRWCKVPEIWCVTDVIIFRFGPIFALLPLRKSRKTTWDIIILYKCNINGNYMMHGSWDVKRERQNFLSIWVISCPFTPLTTQKIKILKKWKKHLEISSLYTSVPKIMIIRYTVL